MSVPESCDEYFSCIKTATGTDGRAAELQWNVISQALVGITAKLRALAELMTSRGSQPPNITNLQEIEEVLEKLYPALKSLKRWVKRRDKRRKQWRNLLIALNEITSVKPPFSEAKIKALLGGYMQNRGLEELERRSSLIEKRILFGIMLEELAERIESGLEK